MTEKASTPSSSVVITGPPCADPADAARLGAFGVATVHEAIGRRGYLGPGYRPAWPGARVGGTAVTALCWAGDNLMIHAAVEQCSAGDIVVVATTSPCEDGLFGELLATSLRLRGVLGAVLASGVRDVAELRSIAFPVWSRAVSAQGSVKATPGSVNVPVVVGGQVVAPGDVIVADDDGVVVVGRDEVGRAIERCARRSEAETSTRAAFERGELGLDRYGLRATLQHLGVEYLTHSQYEQDHPTRRWP